MAYIGKSPGTGIRNRFIYTATAGQTTFSGSDDHSRTLSYTDAEFTDVFLNGVKLDKSDYTATSGTSIVLDEGAAVDDILEVLAFDTFSVFSGEFSQDVTVGGTLDANGNVDVAGDTTMTGDLTVDTDTLHVDSTNDRVGIGTSTTVRALTVNETGTSAIAHFESDQTASKVYFHDANTSQTYSVAIGSVGDDMAFYAASGGNERMRIDSSGNVLVGKTSSDNGATAGIELRGDIDKIYVTDSASSPLVCNRLSSDGNIAVFQKDGTTVGSIGSISDGLYIGSPQGVDAHIRFRAGTVSPVTSTGSDRDNALDLGQSSARWDDVYATNGTIQTSDQNEKQQIAALTTAEVATAKRISTLFKTFKWNDAVTDKGSNARTHAGVIAQDVQAAFTAEGLDASDYALFISATWWEADEAYTDDDGNAQTRTNTYDTQAEAPAGATERTRLGIRYPELLAFVGAATEQRLADFETRLTALEASG